MALNEQFSGLTLAFLLFFSTLVTPETINISKQPSFGGDLFANMRSSFDLAQKQKSQLGSLFNADGFFAGLGTGGPATTNGNNILDGSNNQVQGYNNRLSGHNNSLIGANTTVVGDLNKAFGLDNTIFGSKNALKGNSNKVLGS